MTKSIAASALAFALFLGGTANGQDQITVRKGANFDYTTSLDVNISQSMQGQEMVITAVADGVSSVRAQKVDRNSINWTYQVRDMRLKFNAGMMGTRDTTLTLAPVPFVTSRKGVITTRPVLEDVLPGVPGMDILFNVEQFFLPNIFSVMTPGQTWETTRHDTSSAGGLETVTTQILRHTYQGTVDTLGVSTHRVHSEATTYVIEGAGNMQGMDMSLSGDGTVVSDSYISARDGLLIASARTAQLNARMSLSGMGSEPMLIPMTTVQKLFIVRK